ncbi:sensor histidine kinase [Pontibacter mangrovi]|uniref:histidine kinase n=1 Tax=Pontibacter mangrovi TaxID=2589816 RepID=A0A501WGW7_9BACT|nr:PAS domain-containing sensor histidine kinase [Pontibacter mangrovi]TPE46371.1 PAS domain S-box protein [Pontibacter mangrovi]
MFGTTSPSKQTSSDLASLRLERLNRLLFNHYPDAVYTIGMDNCFHTVNHAACQVLQREPNELIGQPFYLSIHPEHWEEAAHYFRAAKDGHAQRYQAVVRSSSGESVFLDVTNFPLKVGQEMVGVFGIAKDITVQKRHEQELLRTTQELQRQNNELELFRKMIAHDFRSPIARLLGLGKLLQKDNVPPASRQTAITALLQSAQQLDAMVQDLNQVLTLHHQGDEPREWCNLSFITQQCLDNLKEEIQSAKATITLHSSSELELFTVKAFLASIIQNLLSNALKYRSKDRLPQISISLTQQGQEVLIAVTDNGTGMDLDQVGPSLFRMYKRFHRDVDGKGLGLYLVKEQVRLLQGRVEVSSAPDLGTTFTVTLPMQS